MYPSHRITAGVRDIGTRLFADCVNIDHLVKVITRFLHSNITIYSSIIDKYLGTLRLQTSRFFLNFCLLILPILWWILPASYYCGIGLNWCYISFIPSTLTGILCTEKLSLLHFFNYLWRSVWIFSLIYELYSDTIVIYFVPQIAPALGIRNSFTLTLVFF